MKLSIHNKHIYLFVFIVLFIAISDIFMFDAANNQIRFLPSSNLTKPPEVTEGWKYMWSDSEYNPDSSSTSGTWTDFTIPWAPPNTKMNRNVWLKAPLPGGQWEEPCLLFRTYEQSIRVYIQDKLIYEYGNSDFPSARFTLGSPWHLVELPEGYQNNNIYFRIYSNSPIYTGDREEVFIGNKTDLINYRINITSDTIRQRADSLILSFIFIFIGFILMLVFLFRKNELQVSLSLSFFSICMGVWIFTESSTKFIFLDAPIVWLYTGYISCQLIPVGFCSFVEIVFGDTERKLVSFMRKAFILLGAVNLLLDVLDIVPWSVSIRAFHLLFVTCIIVVFYVIYNAAKKGDQEAKLLALSFIVLSLFGIYDMVDRFYLPFAILKGHHITQWGMFIFTVSLIYIVVRRFFDVYDKLKVYSKEIEEKNERLESMWLEVKRSRDQIEDWNKGLEQIVIQKTQAVKNLLDNAGQGFLTFGRDFLINKEYSLECVSIFGEKIENRSFSELICSNEEEKKYLELTFIKILEEKNKSKVEIYIPLLPDEVVINGKNINLQYKLIENAADTVNQIFMVVLTDITEKRALENKVETERKILKMVVKAVTDHNEFTKCIEDYRNFCKSEIPLLINGPSSLDDKLFEIYRKVHTFKGSFAQNDMVGIVNRLHSFEDRLSALRNNTGILSSEDLKSIFNPLEIEKWLDEDLNILKEILGEDFFDYEKVLFVDQVKLMEIEEKMASSLSPGQLRDLLPLIRALRYKPFRELLRPYPKFVYKLSEQMEKLVEPLVIEGGDIPVDIDKYFGFSRALVHVFKNIVDHGIELPDTRIESGKNVAGVITCRIDTNDSSILIHISDDGQGIDLEKVKTKALENKLLSSEELSKLSDNEVQQLIFADGVTTKVSASQVSGRGVGLAAVRDEVEALGGTISVSSKQGTGTEFHISLPYEDLFKS